MELKEKIMFFMLANDYEDKDVAKLLSISELEVWRLRSGIITRPHKDLTYKLMMLLGEDV